MKRTYKNIIFDLDGTLINSNPISLYTLQKAIEIVENKFFDLSQLEIVLGLSGFDAFKILKINNTLDCYNKWKELSKQYASKKEIFPDITEVLKKLKELNINLGIVTSREKERYNDSTLLSEKITPYIDTLVTSDLTNTILTLNQFQRG